MESPIIMSAHSVIATLEGRKWKTRRIVKNPSPLPCYHFKERVGKWWRWENESRGDGAQADACGHEVGMYTIPCPYQVGQTLWVRETWESESYGGLPVVDGENHDIKVRYVADKDIAYFSAPSKFATRDWVKRPAIFLPRVYSRITLKVTDIRVERLQDISLEDIKAEGVLPADYPNGTYIAEFGWEHRLWREGWDAINEKRGPWASNPWVWVISFEVIK